MGAPKAGGVAPPADRACPAIHERDARHFDVKQRAILAHVHGPAASC